jgi:hypothetical protein
MTELLAISLVVIAAIAAISPVIVIWIILSRGLTKVLEFHRDYGVTGGNRVDIVKAEAEVRKMLLAKQAEETAAKVEYAKSQLEANKAASRVR